MNCVNFYNLFQNEYQDKPEESQPESKPSDEEPSKSEPATACGDNESLLIELSKQLEESPLIDAPLDEEPAQPSSNTKFWARMFNHQSSQPQPQQPMPSSTVSKPAQGGPQSKAQAANNPWLDLFADLDPLANPQAFDLKMSGGRSVAEQT